MKLFKKKAKKEEVQYQDIIDTLSRMEPPKLKRLLNLVKDKREYDQKLSLFINGRQDVVDKIESEYLV